MSSLSKFIANAYELAKAGDWDAVLSEWQEFPVLARRCSRYQKRESGWTFLHQAAYFGNESACRELIKFGADVGAETNIGKNAAQVALDKGHSALALMLQRAVHERNSPWAPSPDADLLPSSNAWQEALEHRATDSILVAYADGVVKISKGCRFYGDAFGRILIGWHGTFDPPCDMAGESVLAVNLRNPSSGIG